MRAIRPTRPGGPELLTLADVEPRAPGPGEARVRVAFAGVNFLDVYHRTGLYPLPSPIMIGGEGAGVVEEVGPDVELAIGSRVAWATVPGSYATEVIAPVARLVPIPEGVELDQAAAAMLQGMTAHYLATSTFALGAGTRALVHAAAGGVGLLLGQLARAAGAIAIGTCSTEAKAAAARAAGYVDVIRYDRDDFVAETRRITGGEGVDVVYDSVGQSTFERGLDCLKPRGLMVLFGQSSGPVAPFDLQLLNRKGSLFITRPSMGAYTASRFELLARAEAVLGAVARGELTVTIDRVLPLVDAAEAHRLLESRATSGKLVLAC